MVNFPVVLIHGYTDIPVFTGSQQSVEEVLHKNGISCLRLQIPPHGSIEERSEAAIERIKEAYAGRTVHLFGHSMGGLNARDIATKSAKSDIGFKVKTVTTFGTPHRGVRAIDWCPGFDGNTPFMKVIRSLFLSDFGAFGNLTHRFMTGYNAKNLNNPDVMYFSWAGETAVPTPFFIGLFPFLRFFGPTDGMVNTDSAIWGTHLGTIHGLDHFDIYSSKAVGATIPHLKAAESNQRIPVETIDNGTKQAVKNCIEGSIEREVNLVLAPVRALGALGGLHF